MTSFQNKLLSIAYKDGRYWIYHSKDFSTIESLKLPSDQPWISLKHMNPVSFGQRYHPKYGYKLKKGDIVKFGRVRFRITSISSRKTKTEGTKK
jgi:hypothetical protein